MENGIGRSANMQQAAERVREPAFSAPKMDMSYRRTSVLDNLQPSGNGLAAPDKQRVLMGVTSSASGQADSTFDQRLWLRNERPASLFEK